MPQVQSFGITDQPRQLVGKPKLKAGDNITLSYDLPKNAIVISTTGAACSPWCSKLTRRVIDGSLPFTNITFLQQNPYLLAKTEQIVNTQGYILEEPHTITGINYFLISASPYASLYKRLYIDSLLVKEQQQLLSTFEVSSLYAFRNNLPPGTHTINVAIYNDSTLPMQVYIAQNWLWTIAVKCT